eukprot:scaffold10939_cov105-Cylindrotheca_fusiformis.AAC.4
MLEIDRRQACPPTCESTNYEPFRYNTLPRTILLLGIYGVILATMTIRSSHRPLASCSSLNP